MTAPLAPAAPDRNRALLVRLLALILALLLSLLVAEVSLRAFGAFGGNAGERLAIRDPLATVYVPFGNSGYRPKPGGVEKYRNGARAHFNRMGFRGPEVAIPKPAGVYRIVLLGGSTTAGYDVNDDETIDAYMRTLLAERYPNRCFEVVSLGLGGYDSYQDYERLRVDGIPMAPDLVIIHSGINDVRNARYDHLSDPPDPRTLIWEVEMQRVRTRTPLQRFWNLVKHYSYTARLPGYLAEMLSQRETLHVIQVVEPHDDAVRYFEVNVNRAIDLALGIRARVILSRPPSALPLRNKPTDPVEKSYWIKDAGTTEAYREKLAERMQAIVQRYQAAGQPVTYVGHDLALHDYLDDAHLAPSGNAAVARGFVDALGPLLSGTSGTGSCAVH